MFGLSRRQKLGWRTPRNGSNGPINQEKVHQSLLISRSRNIAMAEIPQEVSDAVAAFETNLNGIEAALAPFFADPELRSKLPPFESAKANLVMAYATNTLFYSMFDTNSVSIYVGIFSQASIGILTRTFSPCSVFKDARHRPEGTPRKG
jgi:hypothetical protein